MITQLYLWLLSALSAPHRGRSETLGRWRRRQIDAAIRKSAAREAADTGVFV